MRDLSNILLLSDLDGTLLPTNKIPLEKDLAAIRKFESLGGRFSIATGRTLHAAKQYHDSLGIHYPMIVYNGAAIYDYEEGVAHCIRPLPQIAEQITREILDFAPFAGSEVLRIDDTYVIRNNEYEAQHIKICGVVPQYCTLSDTPSGEWLKVLFAMPPEHVDKVADFCKRFVERGVYFVRSADPFYEMLPEGITKGSATREFRSLKGFEDAYIVAIGDYDNDIEMLEMADFSAAPQNALPHIRERVDLPLACSNDEGAIAELIEYLIQNQL